MTTAETLNKTLKHHKITISQVRVECSDGVIRKLSDKLTGWRNIDFGAKVDRGIVEEVELNQRLNEKGKRKEVLNQWKSLNGHDATYEMLLKCFIDSRRRDLADFVCQCIKEGPSEPLSESEQSSDETGEGKSFQGPPSIISGGREETDHDLPQLPNLPQPDQPGEDFDFDLKNNRGIAVLITCDYNGTLPGTRRDAEEMLKTFYQLDYQVFQKSNMSAKKAEIINLLHKLSIYLRQYEDDNMEDKVLIFAFSGHGVSDNRIVTYDHKLLSVMDNIIPRFVENHNVFNIPKLFFIDACRGGAHQILKKVPEGSGLTPPKGWVHMKGKYHISYATIDKHVARDGEWMVRLAQAIRSSDDSLQNIVADVSGMTPLYQQSESVDRLRGRFYFKEPPAKPPTLSPYYYCTLL